MATASNLPQVGSRVVISTGRLSPGRVEGAGDQLFQPGQLRIVRVLLQQAAGALRMKEQGWRSG